MHLHWFRHDLRSHDQLALAAARNAAHREGTAVAAVYVLCAEQFRKHDTAPAQIGFLLAQLRALSATLTEKQVPLWILDVPRWRDVPARLIAFAQQRGAHALHFNDEYGLNEQRRDAAVTDAAHAAGLACHRYTDQVLFAPGSVRTGKGDLYTVFTPFKRAVLLRLENEPVRSAPSLRAQTADHGLPPADPVPDSLPGAGAFDAANWPVGEAAARKRLHAFCAHRIATYGAQRDRPDLAGTSRLSAYFSLGVLSPREALLHALTAREDPSAREGADIWISELIWREFYKHLIAGIPRLSMHKPFQVETERLPWRRDPTLLQRWQNGETGIPIVDAAMRCLRETGWMHNRLRMIVASFFCKNLFMDWRLGERYFMQQLIDGDFAANNGGWQWSASVGTDAAPYFRVFNPVTQGERFDPDGAFVRQWLPELQHEPADRIQQVGPRKNYPAPMVDLKTSRADAIAYFQGLHPARSEHAHLDF